MHIQKMALPNMGHEGSLEIVRRWGVGISNVSNQKHSRGEEPKTLTSSMIYPRKH